ncbi:MAG: metallophosphoesterase [Candidatus Aminicenantes bacterium]|jgi:predicted MPP superfamily phosphohydrolase
MARINILHLTDIHIGYNFVYDKVEVLALRIGNQIENADKKTDLVLVSGDIFDGRALKKVNEVGEDKVVSEAVDFFEKLLERLNKRKENSLNKEDFVFLMGNHDLKRDDPKDQFSVFRKFLVKFYGNEKAVYGMYNEKHLYCLKKFEKPKVILLGLNSSKIEKETYSEKELEWLKKIEFDTIAGVNEKAKEKILENIKAAKKAELQEKWYDYGYIELEQITDAIDELKEKVDSLDQYNIVVSFHHHIHPFPELYGKTGDVTLIKNFEQVIERLQTLKVRLVLHGHKHVPLIRPIANDKYLDDPNSMIYVTAGGNIGSKHLPDHYFQMVEVFGKEEKSKIARIKRFHFRQEKVKPPLDILIPPRPVGEETQTEKLRDIIELEKSALLRKYDSEIEEKDNISRDKRIERIIRGLGNILTTFKIIKSRLYDSPEEAMWIILFVHYRILTLNDAYSVSKPKKGKNKILSDIKEFYKKESNGSDDYSDFLFGFLGAKDSKTRDKSYDKLHDYPCNAAQKRIAAYAVVSSFFTDLYMVLSQYADIHYRKIDHKINIKLEEDTFHQNVPSNHIVFSCEADRRSVVVRLKSKDPTSHKIAVLFIKDFEIEMAKYEKDFDEIGLKTYYIVPKVEKEKGKYELDDYNFEAYIPTLLPLLIGEKLYRQKEVFIRELVQNAMDAILLREDLDRKAGE